MVIDSYFSATKLKWILDNVPNAREQAVSGKLLFGTVDSFLIYNLTSERNHLTDVTNASRTMLFNIHEMSWDKELLKLFDIPLSMMPEVKSCDGDFGSLNINGKTIKINGVIGDQQAALVGQNCFNSGDMKSTYGTGCFLMVNTKDKPLKVEEGLLTTVAYKLNNEVNYALEGSIYSCGNIIQWLRDKMQFFENAKDSELLLDSKGNSNNVHFLPAFNGLGAPYWNSDVRAGFYGMTQNTSKKDLVTAAFKSICYQTKDIISILKINELEINNLLVDGGMTSNLTFCQILSDSINVNVLKPSNIESTALGACIAAQIGNGISMDSLNTKLDKEFIPNNEIVNLANDDYLKWKEYLELSIANPI